uniref:Capsid protein n=1 Tax=Rousettus bat astrovirus TaxID=3141900 RepID=A0AAU7E2W5_9VIRU
MPHKGGNNGAKSKPQPKVEVKVNLGKNHKSGARPKQQHPKGKNIKDTVAKEVAKDVRKIGIGGPKPRQKVTVTATVCFIKGCDKEGPTLVCSQDLHPALAKEPEGGSNFGPLAAAAAQFGQWRIRRLVVVLTPMVGSSAVSGSVVRASINTTGGAVPITWGGLGARHHTDVAPGVRREWHVDVGTLNGPRNTWWLTDTNDTGHQSVGVALEIHCLGRTQSTYKDEVYNGNLFMVELRGDWEFTTYASQPGLGVLDRTEVTENVVMKADTDNTLVMEVSSAGAMASFCGEACERQAHLSSTPTAGETVWKIVDAAGAIGQAAAPPPFNWLIKGGIWFLKKVFNKASNSTSTVSYQVYTSLDEALVNNPVKINPGFPQKTINGARVQLTQMNNPNLGPNPISTNFTTSGPPLSMANKFLLLGTGRAYMEGKTIGSSGFLNGGCSFVPVQAGTGSTPTYKTLLKLRFGSADKLQVHNMLLFQHPQNDTPIKPKILAYYDDTLIGPMDPDALPATGVELWTSNDPIKKLGEVLLVRGADLTERNSVVSSFCFLARATTTHLVGGCSASSTWKIMVPGPKTTTSFDFARVAMNDIGSTYRVEPKNIRTAVYIFGWTIGNFSVGSGSTVPVAQSTVLTETTFQPSTSPSDVPWPLFTSTLLPRSSPVQAFLLKPTTRATVDEIVREVLAKMGTASITEEDSSSEFEASDDECDHNSSSTIEHLELPDEPCDSGHHETDTAGGFDPVLAARFVKSLWEKSQPTGFPSN